MTGCVIMASGFSRRFGENKLLADFKGAPMICRILDATDGSFDERVVVTRYKEVADICKEREINVVYHNMPYRNDTVRLGLEALKKNINNCMFCPSDQPLLSGDTIRNMVNKANELPDFIWRLSYGDKVGAPIIFPAWSFSELKNLPEKKGGGAVISKYPGSVRLYNASSEYELMDVDSPEDLIHIKEYQYSCP